MKTTALALAATLLAGTALAQATRPATPGNAAPGATSNAPMPGVSSSTGAAAAAGDRNQAVATTGANAPQPARGANSFSEGEARRRMESSGFSGVGALHKDDGGVWRGAATKGGAPAQVWLDYKGNVGQDGGVAPSAVGTANPPGTAAGRAIDRTLGTNATGANPGGNNAVTTPAR